MRFPKFLALVLALGWLGLLLTPSWAEDPAPPPAGTGSATETDATAAATDDAAEGAEAADEAAAAGESDVQTRGAWDKRPTGARPTKAPQGGTHRQQRPATQSPTDSPDSPDPQPATPRPARRPAADADGPGAEDATNAPATPRPPPRRLGDPDGPSTPEAQDAPQPPSAQPVRRPRVEDGLDAPEPQDPGPNPLGRPNRVRRAQQGDAPAVEGDAAVGQDSPPKVLRNPSVRIGSQREGGAEETVAPGADPAIPKPPPPRRRLSESEASEADDVEADDATAATTPRPRLQGDAEADPTAEDAESTPSATARPPRRLSDSEADELRPERDPAVEAPTKILRKNKRGGVARGALERLSLDAESAPRTLRKPLGDYYTLANEPLAASREERLGQLDQMDRALTSIRSKAKGSDLEGLIADEQALIQATARDPAIMNSPDVLNATHALELKRVGIRPSAATRVADFQDSNLDGEMKELGSGALNVVYRGKYRRANGETFDGVFKEEATENAAQDGGRIGIPRTSPRFGLRNVATTKLDGLLGFDNLATASAMALHKGKLGTVSEFADGESPAGPYAPTKVTAAAYKVTSRKEMDEVNQNLSSGGSDQRIMVKRVGDRDEFFVAKPSMIDVNYDDPRLRRDLVRLQVMDSIAGQVDRHAGNYKIRQDPTGKVLDVKAFDNDLAWGGAKRDDGSFLKIKDLAATKLPPELPPFVDEQTYGAVKNLTKRRLEQEMDGLLAQDEIDAAAARLEEVQAHFANLQAQGRVLKSLDDWTRPDVTAELTKPAKPGAYNSYISRDLEVRREKQAQGILLPYPGSQSASQANN